MFHAATLFAAAIGLYYFNGAENLAAYFIFGGVAFYGLTLVWLSNLKSLVSLGFMLLLLVALPATLFMFLREYHSAAAAAMLWDVLGAVFAPGLLAVCAIVFANKLKAKFSVKPDPKVEVTNVSG